ncbi:hypothetical protein AB0J86_27290 [Micromonospora sp. NPDC049559]|uniref:hypothetical protein n=1 Tax=Micromonospora sp. NPDC049559 TaxID=3155923 RepID=UPI003448D48F
MEEQSSTDPSPERRPPERSTPRSRTARPAFNPPASEAPQPAPVPRTRRAKAPPVLFQPPAEDPTVPAAAEPGTETPEADASPARVPEATKVTRPRRAAGATEPPAAVEPAATGEPVAAAPVAATRPAKRAPRKAAATSAAAGPAEQEPAATRPDETLPKPDDPGARSDETPPKPPKPDDAGAKPDETRPRPAKAAAKAAGKAATKAGGTAAKARKTAPRPRRAAGDAATLLPPDGPQPVAAAPAGAGRTPAEPAPGLTARLLAHPGYAPELLATAAVESLGPGARAWAERVRTDYPSATPEGLARLATRRFVRIAGTGGAVSAGAGLLAPLAELVVVAWTQAGLVLHLAAAYGHEPTHPDRAADLLVLTRVHPDDAAARDALAAAGRAGPEGEDALDRALEAAWRLGVPLAAQAGGWLALRAAARLLPGAAALAAAAGGTAVAQRLAARAVARYRR